MFRLGPVCGSKFLLMRCRCFKRRNRRCAHVIGYTYTTYLHYNTDTIYSMRVKKYITYVYYMCIHLQFACIYIYIYTLVGQKLRLLSFPQWTCLVSSSARPFPVESSMELCRTPVAFPPSKSFKILYI